MKLTTEQRSEIISEMASSEAGFNELMRVLLDSFSKQERALFLEEHKGEYCCPLNFKTTRFPYPQRPSIGVADFFFEK